MTDAPLIVMFRRDEDLVCHLHPTAADSYKTYGLMICDLIRHVADCFGVSEEDVFEWVEKEHFHHTTDITRPS